MTSEYLLPGTLLHGGTYRIVRALGQGGFGITYLAEQVNLGRQVAIKEFFLKDLCERQSDTGEITIGTASLRATVERYREKFLKEARNIARLDHPHIVGVIDIFEENGTAYFAMNYCPGGSLAALVNQKGRLPESEACEYILQIASALSHLHAQQMNHLDVKPANVMLDKNGKAVLIDFGLSKQYDEHGEQTSTTPVGISEGYAPLEQYRQGGVAQFSPETDIYALGATYYKLLTGETPPTASDVNEDGGIQTDLLRQYGVSEASIQLISHAMTPIRKRRLADATEFQRVLDGDAIHTLQVPMPDAPTIPMGNKQEENIETVRDVKRTYAPAVTPAPKEVPIPASVNQAKGVATIRIVDEINGHEYVDLGLPSGTKWATCNVGASSPEDYGDYFAWGETTPKSTYVINNMKLPCSDIPMELDFAHDAACTNWGGTWRIPNQAQLEELCNNVNCTWTWTTLNGKKGYRITSKHNGNSIFLPAAGFRNSDTLYNGGRYGFYWSRLLRPGCSDYAYCIRFHSDHVVDWSYYGRYSGRSVRPVSE